MDIRKWIDKFSTDMQLKYNSQATHDNYVSVVKQFLYKFNNYREPKEVPNDLIKNWLLQANTINTRKHRLCALRAFYSLSVGMPKKVTKIPYPQSEKKLPIVLSVNEIEKMFKACSNLKHKAILAVLYSCGLRVSELVNLKWQHLDRDRGIINIIAAKGNKDRQVPLNPSLVKILIEYWKVYKPYEYVFNGQNSPQYSERSVLEVIKQLAAAAAINKRVYTHLIRHCSFTHLLEAGIDLSIIQKVAGHNKSTTTQIYTHISHNFISTVKTPLELVNLP